MEFCIIEKGGTIMNEKQLMKVAKNLVAKIDGEYHF